MAYFSVSYQLNKQKDYKPLWAEMERLYAHKAMRDYYLVDVDVETSAELSSHLQQFVDDKDDMIFVAKLTSKPASHRCYEGTAAWIKERF
jgi:hypothetical protein